MVALRMIGGGTAYDQMWHHICQPFILSARLGGAQRFNPCATLSLLCRLLSPFVRKYPRVIHRHPPGHPLLGSLSSTSKLETSSASAFSSSIGLLVRRLSLPPLDPIGFLNSSTEAFFCTRPSSLCTTTVASTLTSSDTFPTPSTADFYTCSSAPSLLQPLLLCSLYREYLYGPPPIVSQCSAKRAHQVLSRCQTTATYDCRTSFAALRPHRSSISSVKVNRRQTFTAVDNTVVSLTSGQDLRPSQELDLVGA
ncbi:hypothetical protein BHE74_00008576 [Ensete ventricosum]|nr:hypothetical protein BHE74_00008576 [Ensete ventricosum]